MNTTKKISKGPIRFEAIVPMLIILGLTYGYFHFFFDSHVRRAFEYGGSYVHGAEVNVADVHTSFWNGSFEIRGIQITNKDKPETNALEIGRVHFKFLWDALLRMKFVVDNASVDQFSINTKRTKPGFVYPAPQNSDLDKIETETKGSAITDAGQLMQGAVPQVNENELNNLSSLSKIQGLQTDLEKKQSEWKDSVASLPSAKDFKDLQGRISNIRIGGSKDPMQIQKQISEVTALVNEINQKTNEIKTKSGAIQNDIGRFNESLGGINKFIDQDMKALESKLKLPRLDVQSISKQFFGHEVLEYVRKAQTYIDLAQKYMPPAKSKDQNKSDAVQVHERRVGKNFEFPRTNSYPLFWLKRAAFSSKSDGSPFGGDVTGELLDVTSNPPLIGKPVQLNLTGDFPQQDVRGVEIKAIFDHRGTVATQSMTAKVSSFAVEGRMLSQEANLKFGFKKASAQMHLSGKHRDGFVGLKVDGTFNKVDYMADSDNAQIKEILLSAVKDLPSVGFQAEVAGPFSDLSFKVSSNLGEKLQSSFEKQFKGKLDDARNKLRAAIEDKIGGPKKDLTQKFGSTQSGLNSQIGEKTKEVDRIKSLAESKLAEAKRQIAGGGGQVVDDIRKKLGF